MDVRTKMISIREGKGLSVTEMAHLCNVGVNLLYLVEDNRAVTHPNIVKRIARGYGLDMVEAEDLMPEHLRAHGPNYEPDRFVDQRVSTRQITIFGGTYSGDRVGYSQSLGGRAIRVEYRPSSARKRGKPYY